MRTGRLAIVAASALALAGAFGAGVGPTSPTRAATFPTSTRGPASVRAAPPQSPTRATGSPSRRSANDERAPADEVAALRSSLADPLQADAHARALASLAALGSPEALAGVLEAFAQRSSLVDARDAALALLDHPSEPAVDGLVALLVTAELPVRLSALEVLLELSEGGEAGLRDAARSAIAEHGAPILDEATGSGFALRKSGERISRRAEQLGSR